MVQTAVVALGANLGDRLATLRSAVAGLAGLGRVVARSGVYETAPLGPPQPDYLNAVVLLHTGLGPHELLQGLLDVERGLGRERRERWGPRVIDLDLLALGQDRVHTPTLTLPHPEAHRRSFVLVPLAEIAPQLELPGVGRVAELVAALPAADRAAMRRLDDTI